MYRVSKEHVIYQMSAKHPPVLRVPDGSRVVFETCDCFEDQIQSEDMDFGTLDWERINPASGPVYVEGAEPGDLLLVNIEHIHLARQGVMTTGPGLGVLGDELQENVIRVVPIENQRVIFSEDISISVSPMIGVIGTAPPEDQSIACGTPGFHGGNMDCKRITRGATLVLPVNVPGALLAMGDLHACMGDGEVAVCGVEIAGEVTVSLHILKNRSWPAPMLFHEDSVMTIASALTLDEAAIMATKQMVDWLQQECGLSRSESIFLLSAGSDVRICQIVDPLKTVRVELPKKHLAAYSPFIPKFSA
ncbi:acetamidase/formamidase family protein [Alicyclobacillus tolerans]|uniref:Amidase n=1 Tax=Alicyclobacillus tolerans TaxID=90970 RepID=A0A1M6R8V7_9BACL|nr:MULTISPECIES: acetamidase/formamidase family protein [Alicyclobacillus]QRF22392.1 acetamidase/formamidase family protein [Alicyclobacillus sp. TC]SHK28905.1 amidase [Alicyclobacillus montanus]